MTHNTTFTFGRYSAITFKVDSNTHHPNLNTLRICCIYLGIFKVKSIAITTDIPCLLLRFRLQFSYTAIGIIIFSIFYYCTSNLYSWCFCQGGSGE